MLDGDPHGKNLLKKNGVVDFRGQEMPGRIGFLVTQLQIVKDIWEKYLT